MKYTALQVKTSYSILDSLNSIPKLVKLAHNFGYKALAITDEDNEKKSFKYNNFSKYYDTTDKGIRVISLVNDNNGFYTSGSIVEFGTDNFGMYDENGHPTVEPGFKIDIGELVNGQYTVTITTN